MERKRAEDGGKLTLLIPVDFVALPKYDSLSHLKKDD